MRTRQGTRLLLSLLLLLCARAQATEPLETVILGLVVNQQNLGQQFFQLDTKAQVFSHGQTLRDLGLKADLWQGLPESFALAALAPNLRFEFDLDKALLSIQVAPQWFVEQQVGLKKTKTSVHDEYVPEDLSLLFNYQLNLNGNRKQGVQSLSLPSELALRFKNILFYSNFYGLYQQGQGDYKRLLTQFVYDRPEDMYRIIIGDFIDAEVFGGISVQRKFNFKPRFRAYPELNLSYLFDTASLTKLYINNEFVAKWRLRPGRVLFQDLLPRPGHGEAVLLIQDLNQQRLRFVSPFRINSQQLKPGVHDFRYNLGFKRRHLGAKNVDYGKAVFSAFHRIGLYQNLSIGGRFDLEKHYVGLDFFADWVVSGRVKVNTGILVSREGQQSAYGFYNNSHWQWSQFNLSLGFAQFDKHYKRQLNDNEGVRQQLQLGLGFFPKKVWGSLNLSFDESRFHHGKTPTRQWALNYYQRLLPHMNLLISAREGQEQNQRQRELFVALQYHLDKKPQLGYSYYQQNKTARHQIKISTPQTRGQNFAYDLRLQKQANKATELNARLHYRGTHAEYDAALRHTGDNDYLNMSVAGGLAWLKNEGVYMSRPIHDSFALVKTGIADLPVRLGGQISTYTNQAGNALLPDLNAWYQNRVNISPADLGLNYQIDEPVKYVRASQRSGLRLPFNIYQFTAVEGQLYQRTASGKQALEHRNFQLLSKNGDIAGFTAKEGYFYLENVKAGDYRLQLKLEQGLCLLHLTIAESEQILQNLGVLYCEQ